MSAGTENVHGKRRDSVMGWNFAFQQLLGGEARLITTKQDKLWFTCMYIRYVMCQLYRQDKIAFLILPCPQVTQSVLGNTRKRQRYMMYLILTYFI